MLKITIKDSEYFNTVTQEFVKIPNQDLILEHSLVSISKWESNWHKPFLDDKNEKTNEETLDYIKCMTVTKNVDPLVYNFLTLEQIQTINEYIQDPMTATWFNDNPNAPKGMHREQITSELIYYWMIALNIPFECQKWHLNRLLTLIRVCNIKNNPGKKYSKREILSKNAALNAARKKKYGTSG